jgi:hypothetical protein
MSGNMDQAMKLVMDHTRTSFTMAKSGSMYRRSSGEPYQASAPGEPPAIKDGALNASLRTDVKLRPDGVEGSLTASTPYALALETGKNHATGARARPYLIPAVKVNFKRIGKILSDPGIRSGLF